MLIKKSPRVAALALIAIVSSVLGATAPAQAASTAPHALASMSALDQLPVLDDQTQTGMQSTFQRNGGYDDYSGFEYETTTDRIYADLTGPGEITRIWATNLQSTDRIHIYFDGETTPRVDMAATDFFSGTNAPFRAPLVMNSAVSSGGYVSYLPMLFAGSVTVALQKHSNMNEYLQVNYEQFTSDTVVSTWTSSESGSQDSSAVRALWNNVGTDPKSVTGNTTTTGTANVPAGGSATLLDVNGPASVSSVKLHVPGISSRTTSLTDNGRAFNGASGQSSFAVAVNPSSTSVSLTRRHDDGVANQKAEVWVDGTDAGTWFDPGSAGTANYTKWGDSTFTIPSALTNGKSHISVQIKFISSDIDWNEFYYWVNSTVGGAQVLTDSVDVGTSSSETAHSYSILGQTFSGTQTFYYQDDPAIAALLNSLTIKMYWDGSTTPAVDSPLGSFFAIGQYGYSKAPLTLMVGMDSSENLYMYFPMPFQSHAKITLSETGPSAVNGITYSIATKSQPGSFDNVGYFTTEYRSQAVDASNNHDATLLDRDGAGAVVGVVMSAKGVPSPLSQNEYFPPVPGYAPVLPHNGFYFGWVEGDERIYTDGNRTPAYYGTGIEDQANAGFGWQNGFISLPTHGMSSLQSTQIDSTNWTIQMAWHRLFLEDKIDFKNHIRISQEHGFVDETPMAALSTLVYYYFKPTPRSVRTDLIDVGNSTSETAHGYTTAGGSLPMTETNAFEGDYSDAYVSDDGRTITGHSQFTAAIGSANDGIVLRRRFDQSVPIQEAQVKVDGSIVGTWRVVGGNTSSAWKESDFAIPSSYTAGKSSVQITITPTSASGAWNEYRYEVSTIATGAGYPIPPAPGATTNIANADFESGDLTGWTSTGSGFDNAHVTTQTAQNGVAFGQHGSYHYFGFAGAGGDTPQGSMRTPNFLLGGDGKISFMIGAGSDIANEALQLRRASDDAVLMSATGEDTEAYSTVMLDARDWIGSTVYLKAVDSSGGGWGHINLDNFTVPVSTFANNLTGAWTTISGTWADVSSGLQGTSTGDSFRLNSQQASDLSLEADVKVTTAGAAALVFRANSAATQFYAANIDYTQQRVSLWGPGMTTLTASEPISLNSTYHLRVTAVGDAINVYLNGGTTPVISTHNSLYTSGYVGVNVWNGNSIIQDLTLSPFANNLPANWTDLSGSWSEVTGGLRGTATGDGLRLNSAVASDLTIEADLKIMDSGAAALVFRSNAAGTQFYAANVDYTQQRVALWGPGLTTVSVSEPIALNTSYHLKVTAAGSTIQIYLNGILVLAPSSTGSLTSGNVGVDVWNGTSQIQGLTVS